MEVLSLKLFDLDGTLIDSNGVWIQVDLDFLAQRGLEPTQEYTDFVSHSIFPIASEFTRTYYKLPETVEEIMESWMVMAREAYHHHVPLKLGVREYLTQCAATGEPMAIVTACVPELCLSALKRHGIDHFFSQIIFAQELGLEKRDPEVFRAASRILDVAPGECILFEDSPEGCKSAKSVGMTVVGVYDHYYESAEAEQRSVCDHYIHSFTELVK
jgi:HAD superfamily hydrolase (TIGR01509 family)